MKHDILKSSLIKQIKGNNFAVSILTLATGTAFAQLIPVLVQPFLRRMYTPEDFGLFSVYMSIISITTIIYSLRYAQTINIPKNDVEASNIFSLSLLLSIGSTIILYILISIFEAPLAQLLNIPDSRSIILYFVPLSSLLLSVFNIINFWLIRKKEFRLSSLNKIYRRTSEVCVSLGFGIHYCSFGLIFGDIIGNTVNILSGSLKLRKIGFTFKHTSKRRIKAVAHKYSHMPRYNAIPALLNSLCLSLPVLFINRLYDPTISGYYHLTMLVLNIPIVFIGKAISEALIQRLSELQQNNKPIQREIAKLVAFLGGVGLLITIVILLFGPILFDVFFGNIYRISGEYAKIFVFLSMIRLVASPLNVVFIILQKVKYFAKWQVAYFVGIISLPIFNFLEFKNFLILLVSLSSVFYLINILMIRKVVRAYESSLLNVVH